MAENPVRETSEFVMENARHVSIDNDKVNELAKKWSESNVQVPLWADTLHFKSTDAEKMLTYLIILDALNFCFWSSEGDKWSIDYDGKRYDGYFALSLSLKKFFEDYPQHANFNYLSDISFPKFRAILGGRGNLLYKQKRWDIARAVSQVMIERYESRADIFVSESNFKISHLIFYIASELPSFADAAVYKHRPVYFWKRAQILAVDIYGAFGGVGFGAFDDLAYPTAFADYKVPQILTSYGILVYSHALQNKIKNKICLPRGSASEVEIRSAIICAVERLKRALANLGKNFHSFEIDWILWNESQNREMLLPYHRTRTWFY